MTSNVRIPDDIREALNQLRIPLQSQHSSAAPTIQDLVSVALKRFIKDWKDLDKKEEILSELLDHRKVARSRMGKKKGDRAKGEN